jgi:hypothetical protein
MNTPSARKGYTPRSYRAAQRLRPAMRPLPGGRLILGSSPASQAEALARHVMAHNRRAVDLYQRMGFSIEGRRAECLLAEGRFVDELHGRLRCRRAFC